MLPIKNIKSVYFFPYDAIELEDLNKLRTANISTLINVVGTIVTLPIIYKRGSCCNWELALVQQSVKSLMQMPFPHPFMHEYIQRADIKPHT